MKRFFKHIYQRVKVYFSKPELLKAEVEEPFAYEGGEVTLLLDVKFVNSIRLNGHKIKVKGRRIECVFKIPAFNDTITLKARNWWRTSKAIVEYKLIKVKRQREFSPISLAWQGNEDSQLKKKDLEMPKSKVLREFNLSLNVIKQPDKIAKVKMKPFRMRLNEKQIKLNNIIEPELNTEQL